MLKEMIQFEVGDEVDWCGAAGTVTKVELGSRHPVTVRFSGSNSRVFLLDGRGFSWHTEPSLKLIKRPKPELIKNMVLWMTIYPEDSENISTVYDNEDEAKENAGSDLIAVCRLSGSYSVEK